MCASFRVEVYFPGSSVQGNLHWIVRMGGAAIEEAERIPSREVYREIVDKIVLCLGLKVSMICDTYSVRSKQV